MDLSTLALLITIIFCAALIWSILTSDGAVHLNLEITGGPMAKIGDKFLATLSPTDLMDQPAPVFDVTFGFTGASYDVVVSPDGLSATYTATAIGTGSMVKVAAKNALGTDLFDEAALPDVVPEIPVEVDLGLTVVPA